MLIHAMGTVVVEHHDFAPDVDGKALEDAWQSWFSRAFA
jgi:hypothetical protein